MKLLDLLNYSFYIIASWKDLYWMVGYKKFTSKIGGKGHSVVFNEENECVNAVIVVCRTENMHNDV